MRKIVHTHDTCGGSPRIDGTRLTCGNIVWLLSGPLPKLDSFFAVHDYLTPEDIKASLVYCAGTNCIGDRVRSFCQGCTLDRRAGSPPDTIIRNEGELRDFIERGHGQAAFTEQAEESENYWETANALLEKLFGNA